MSDEDHELMNEFKPGAQIDVAMNRRLHDYAFDAYRFVYMEDSADGTHHVMHLYKAVPAERKQAASLDDDSETATDEGVED
jgi:hypothetical protein